MPSCGDARERVVTMLGASSIPLATASIARMSGMSTRTAYAILRTLLDKGMVRRSDNGLWMGANCYLPADWTSVRDDHMDPDLLEECMDDRWIPVLREGLWLGVDAIHNIAHVSVIRVCNDIDSGRLPHATVMGRRMCRYRDVLEWIPMAVERERQLREIRSRRKQKGKDHA